MCLTKQFYETLVQILHDTGDLEMGASLSQIERVVAQRFDISESTVRNWRRGTTTQMALTLAKRIIVRCEKLAPARVSELELIASLSGGVPEIKRVAEQLVERITEHVLGDNSTWHIYSGPLKMAYDTSRDNETRLRLMRQSSMIIERILDMGIDQSDIPCVSELIRYSTHGWYNYGFFRIRERSLNSKIAGLHEGYLTRIESALYIGDGCANPKLFSGDFEQAKLYTDQALALLDQADPREEKTASMTIQDARILIRALQAIIVCHYDFEQRDRLLKDFTCDYEKTNMENEWADGLRMEALGYIELIRREDLAKAASYFEQVGLCQDRWLSQFDIPFSSTSCQSIAGYAMLLMEGPSDRVKSQISEGLIRTVDPGSVPDQIRARLCQSRFYDYQEDSSRSKYHLAKAASLSTQHDLVKWYDALNTHIFQDNRVKMRE